LGEGRFEGGDDLIYGDGGHAGEIDGAGAEEAGATGGGVADDVVDGAEGTGEGGFGGAEEGDRGDIEEGGEVHGAGVIGEEEIAGAEFLVELGEGSFADEIDEMRGGEVSGGDDGIGDGAIFFDAEDFPGAVGALVEGVESGGETLWEPALCGSVFGAWAEADDGGSGGGDGAWSGEGRGVSGIGADEGGEGEVIVDLVLGRSGGGRFLFGAFGLEDLVEEPASMVAWSADASGDVGEEDFEGGAEGIGEEDGGVELVADFAGDLEEIFVGENGDHGIDLGDFAPEAG